MCKNSENSQLKMLVEIKIRAVESIKFLHTFFLKVLFTIYRKIKRFYKLNYFFKLCVIL